jgi:hypothetical protein
MFRSLLDHHQAFLRIKSVDAAYMLGSQNVHNCYNLLSKTSYIKSYIKMWLKQWFISLVFIMIYGRSQSY